MHTLIGLGVVAGVLLLWGGIVLLAILVTDWEIKKAQQKMLHQKTARSEGAENVSAGVLGEGLSSVTLPRDAVVLAQISGQEPVARLPAIT